ncbi:MAG: DegV family EDD domain-containing protein [Clostridiales bacterium]|nr:DegV family EDD domain-containing protein [Clostridiales bacterium]
MKWNIVADSSIDLFNMEIDCEDIKFSTVPFVINVGEAEYIDNENLDTNELITAMKKCSSASCTACPSTDSWYEKFNEEGNVIALTITSGLSGSYNSAYAAKNMILENNPDKKIVIIDSLSTGPAMVLILRKICELISKDKQFDDVINETRQYMKHLYTSFVLSSFDNLVKNGRMNKLTGFIANKLGLLGIGIGSEKGTIEIKGIARGREKAMGIVINDMKQRAAQVKTVVISHCHNIEFAEKVKTEIQNIWSDVKVTIIPTRGLCSYYAEKNGLIIGYASGM